MTDWDKLVTELESEDPVRLEWYDVLGQAAKNIPRSAYQFGADIAQAVIHPVETGKAMGRVGMGAVEKAIPGSEYMLPGPIYDRTSEEEFEAMIDFFANRYGDVESFKRTVANDPVGVLADFATFFTGGGGAAAKIAPVAGKVKGIRKAAGPMRKTGEVMQEIGARADPIQVPKHLVKSGDKLVGATGMSLSEKMYESAAKWPTVAQKPGRTSKEMRQQLTRTALSERIMPTYRGLSKLKGKIDDLDIAIEELIRLPTEEGITVSSKDLLRHFKELEQFEWKYSGKPVDNVREIRNIKKQFIEVHGIFDEKGKLTGFKQMTPEEVQRKKVKIYHDLENHYNKVMTQPASVKAQKAIARGAKDTLAEIIPEISDINKSYGPLKELEKAIERAAGRISNRDILGIGVPIKGGAGYAATGGAAGGAVAGVVIGLLDAPIVKAKLAILLDKAKKEGTTFRPTQAAIDLGLFQTGREAERQENF